MPKKTYDLFLSYDTNELETLTGNKYTSGRQGYDIFINGKKLSEPFYCDGNCEQCEISNIYDVIKQKCPIFKEYNQKYGELEPDDDMWFVVDENEVKLVCTWRNIDKLEV